MSIICMTNITGARTTMIRECFLSLGLVEDPYGYGWNVLWIDANVV